MRIALDATPLSVPTGGVARYTWELARALAESYPEDEYWLASDQPFAAPPGVHSAKLPQSPLTKRWWLYGLNRELARHDIDVFHGTDFAVPYWHRRPAVMTVHDLSPWLMNGLTDGTDPAWQPDAGRVRSRTPRLLKMGLADRVITPSEAVRKQAIERFDLNPERVTAIPLAARCEFQPAEPHRHPNPYFLFVGTLEPRKNIARLIAAWRVLQPVADLFLVGRLRRDYAAPSPEPGLHVLGAVPDAELPALYSGALACVYPSLYEGFGLPVLEAMQCGALVVTSLDPAIAEIAHDAALQVPAEDTAALSGALGAIASDPAHFEPLRQAGLRRAARYTWRETARRTREVYVAASRAATVA